MQRSLFGYPVVEREFTTHPLKGIKFGFQGQTTDLGCIPPTHQVVDEPLFPWNWGIKPNPLNLHSGVIMDRFTYWRLLVAVGETDPRVMGIPLVLHPNHLYLLLGDPDAPKPLGVINAG